MEQNQLSKKQQKFQERAKRSKVEKRKKQALTFVYIILGLVFIFFALYLPSIQPIIAPEDRPHPQADGNMLGDPNAPIKIEVYSDFKCGACNYFFESVEPLIVEQYVETGIASFTYLTFGNIIHPPESGRTAQAVYCAEDQGNFWDMHDYIFTNYENDNSSIKVLKSFADKIGMDVSEFSDCMSENKYSDRIVQDSENGREAEIPGTPSVVVNGILIDTVKVVQFADVQAAIEEILQEIDN